jgi:hypothetical protein
VNAGQTRKRQTVDRFMSESSSERVTGTPSQLAGCVAFVGEPRVGDIDEEFDGWFVKQLEQTELGNLLDMPNDELMEAGNGAGELGVWVAVAGSMRGRLFITLSYEPINGMGVVICDDELPSTA